MKAFAKSIRLGVSLSAIGIAGLAQPALAQDAPTGGSLNAAQVAERGENADEIVVTGVRESLRSAQAIKRNADQIVDSVNA
ncbi:hypothetical protein [Sphingomonas sp. Leaf4]|nr:hypothetical protein [Sphingomonas sp. Leaf4]